MSGINTLPGMAKEDSQFNFIYSRCARRTTLATRVHASCAAAPLPPALLTLPSLLLSCRVQ